MELQVAITNEGAILGLKATLRMDHGAYPGVPHPGSVFAGLIGLLLPGPYRVKGYSYTSEVFYTNKCVLVPYRGPWEMETWASERLVDIIARELELDPADVRRRNLVDGDPDDRMVTGPSLAGITSRETLDRALRAHRVRRVPRACRSAARAEGRYLGIGFATFLEAAPGPPEMRAASPISREAGPGSAGAQRAGPPSSRSRHRTGRGTRPRWRR